MVDIIGCRRILSGQPLAIASDTLWEPSPASRSTQRVTRIMGVHFASQTGQLPDVALAVGDVNVARCCAEQFGGQTQVTQPAHAFLAFDRRARRIGLSLERGRALKLLAVPELHRSERQPVGRHNQARMHQQAADGVDAVAAELVLASAHLGREAGRLRTSVLPGKLRHVMKYQGQAVGDGEPALRRIEMTLENLSLAHPVIGENAISCLRAGPVLASQRDALSKPGCHLFQPVDKAAGPNDRRQAGTPQAPRQTNGPPYLAPLAADSLDATAGVRKTLTDKMWAFERCSVSIQALAVGQRSRMD